MFYTDHLIGETEEFKICLLVLAVKQIGQHEHLIKGSEQVGIQDVQQGAVPLEQRPRVGHILIVGEAPIVLRVFPMYHSIVVYLGELGHDKLEVLLCHIEPFDHLDALINNKGVPLLLNELDSLLVHQAKEGVGGGDVAPHPQTELEVG